MLNTTSAQLRINFDDWESTRDPSQQLIVYEQLKRGSAVNFEQKYEVRIVLHHLGCYSRRLRFWDSNPEAKRFTQIPKNKKTSPFSRKNYE